MAATRPHLTADRDLTVSHEVESIRRSVAMLAPGQWALRREDAMAILAALAAALAEPGDDDAS